MHASSENYYTYVIKCVTLVSLGPHAVKHTKTAIPEFSFVHSTLLCGYVLFSYVFLELQNRPAALQFLPFLFGFDSFCCLFLLISSPWFL